MLLLIVLIADNAGVQLHDPDGQLGGDPLSQAAECTVYFPWMRCCPPPYLRYRGINLASTVLQLKVFGLGSMIG